MRAMLRWKKDGYRVVWHHPNIPFAYIFGPDEDLLLPLQHIPKNWEPA